MGKGKEERFYDKRNVSHKLLTEAFLKLPRKCQEMFFEYMENFQFDDGNPYRVFAICNLDYADYCNSPIEMMFALAFDIISFRYYEGTFALNPQEEIVAKGNRYIADFVFDTAGEFGEFYSSEHNVKLVIECDGHKYHKSTKEQVKHDNERDFNLKMAGYEILHFSGSQIYENPWKCAEDAISYISSKTGRITRGGAVDEWLDKTSQKTP